MLTDFVFLTVFFFFNDTATTEIYTLSLHDALPISAAMAGGVIAFYQLGYGLAAFGVGPLLDAGVGLPTVYAVAAGVAVVMGLVSFAVVPRQRRIPAAV